MTAVAGFHPLIKVRRPNHDQSSKDGAEQERIQIKDADNLRGVFDFADIHKTNHCNGDND